MMAPTKTQLSQRLSGATAGGASGPYGHGRPIIHRQSIFGDDVFLVQSQIAGDGAYKPPVEDSAGELFPIFVLDSLEKP